MIVLGLHFEHDGGATLMKDGEIAISIEAERITSVKHDGGLAATLASIGAALSQTGIRAEEIDAIAYSDLWDTELHGGKLDRLDRRVEFQHQTHGRRLAAVLGTVRDAGFDKLIPAQIASFRPEIPVFTVCHSISHAATALYMGKSAQASGLVIDGYGTCCATMGYNYRNGVLTRLEDFQDRFLLGAGYDRIGMLARELNETAWFDVPGKIMGLQAYGSSRPDWTDFFYKYFFASSAETGFEDYVKNFNKFDLTSGAFDASQPTHFREMCGRLFPGGLARGATTVDDGTYRDLVASMQDAFTRIIVRMVEDVIAATGDSEIFLSGGCALNILANSAVAALPGVSSLYVPPNPSDAGQAMGCAIVGMYALTGIPLHRPEMVDHDVGNPLVGSALLDDPADSVLPSGIARVAFSWEDNDDIVALARRFLDGQIVGVVAGSSEIGPRALGNRSILALASFPQMKDIINRKVKAREWWRPFAPVCRGPDANTYFETPAPSRYMLMNDVVREEWRDKLSSITHEDHTCRLQVLGKRQDNTKLWDLLTAIEKEGGIPVLLNTSFNRSKKPLVNSANEALQLLSETDMDAVVFQSHFCFKL